MNFQEKLHIMRKAKGFSQEDLAEKLGISRQAVAKWEQGQAYPDIDNFVALSDLFKVSIDRMVKTQEDDCGLYTEIERSSNRMPNDIISFLCKAKKSTYAAKSTEALASRPNSHDYHYFEGEYQYIDTYLGGEKFIGEEAVWYQGIPVWSMNYCGRVLGENFSGDFLKEALLLVTGDNPYRGPLIYRNGDYTYHCSVNGGWDWFIGQEEIFCLEQKIYECCFHGGEIK